MEYHSRWYKLKKSVTWLIKIRNVLLKRENCSRISSLEINDLVMAEKVILAYVQKSEYSDEYNKLAQKKPINNVNY